MGLSLKSADEERYAVVDWAAEDADAEGNEGPTAMGEAMAAAEAAAEQLAEIAEAPEAVDAEAPEAVDSTED